jgi:DNA-binding CsgD family transcriptional regulator
VQRRDVAVSATPFVGRESESAIVSAALRRGAGAVVIGSAGVGKTRLAREAAADARADGLAVERVAATEAAAAIPFGAMASIVPDGAPLDAPVAILRATTAALRARHDGRTPVLLVDDAHLLDRASAALVHHLAAHDVVRVLATVRAGAEVPDAVTALWKDVGAELVTLEPLSDAAARRLAHELAGGPVDPESMRSLLRAARGNPLHLVELVRWREADEAQAGARLLEVIGARLGDLSAGQHRALALVALAEPLALTTLERLVTLDDVEALERRGLLVREADGADALRTAHPLHGEVVRARLGAVESRQLRAALIDALPADQHGARLLRATWALRDGRRDDPALLAAGAQDALAGLDPALAAELGQAALDAGAGIDVVIPLATALRATRRFEEADALLADHEPALRRSPLASAYVFNRAMGLQWGLRRPDRALRFLSRVQHWEPSSDWGAMTRQLGATLLISNGRLREGIAMAEPLLAAPGISDAIRLRLAVVLGHALPLVGRPQAGLDAIARARALCAPGADIEWPVDTAIAFATLPLGQGWDEAEARLRRRHEAALAAGSDDAATYCEMALVRIVRVRGDAAQARALAESAAGRLLLMDPREHAATCLADAAQAAAELGDLDAARVMLERVDELRETWPSSVASRHRAELARASLGAASGDPAAGQRAALAAADVAGEAVVWEAEALYHYVRVGGPARVVDDRLAHIAAMTAAPLVALWSRQVSAVRRGDALELEQVGRAWDALGARRWAAEAAEQAAGAHAARGQRGAAGRAAARARRMADVPEAAVDLHTLRPRERQVADLVALDLTNAEIAERLHLSVRTVESHVYRATARLGLRSRTELAALVRVGGAPRP